MTVNEQPRYEQPRYEQAVGIRVGIVAGGLLGALAVALTGVINILIVLGGGAIGGAVGFWYVRRERQRASRGAERDELSG